MPILSIAGTPVPKHKHGVTQALLIMKRLDTLGLQLYTAAAIQCSHSTSAYGFPPGCRMHT